MRIIAQRCLYGVDKNPLAAEMAKLSLWLLTVAKDKPFEFLDHAIRCGDSLVGLHDLEQLRHYSLKPDADDAVLFKGPLDSAVDEAINLRLKLEDLPANTVEDIERQEKLLKEANEKSARLRCAADLLVAAEFWGENAKDKQERVRHNAVRSGYYVENGPTEEFEQAAAKECRGQSMFHWPLEFPEVIVKRGGFDAFVGNPPFLGGKRFSGTLGTQYLLFIKAWYAPASGGVDLVAYFFRRGFLLSRTGGIESLIATNTIAQADTRMGGLAAILDAGGTIVLALRSARWPGNAAVEITIVSIHKGEYKGQRLLDDIHVDSIDSFLTSETIAGSAKQLRSNKDLCFMGTNIIWEGFILSPPTAKVLLDQNSSSDVVIKPFMNGSDLNGSSAQLPSRYVIDFGNMDLEIASERFPECLAIAKEKVKPLRDKSNRKTYKERWWQF